MTPTTKKIFIGLSTFTAVVLVLFIFSGVASTVKTDPTSIVAVTPIEHASFALTLGELHILNDPVGKAGQYAEVGAPDVIFISQAQPEHFNIDTLAAVLATSTTIIAPEQVFAQSPAFIQEQMVVMGAGDSHTVGGLQFTVVPLYQSADADPAVKPGNGYVLQTDQTRVYIAGATAAIPDLPILNDIQVAFIPMDAAETMSVETAAAAVLRLSPETVYPYQYRSDDQVTDVEKFQRLIAVDNPAIEVITLDWYNQ